MKPSTFWAVIIAGICFVGLLLSVAIPSTFHYVYYVEGLVDAAYSGDAKKAELLLNQGADPDAAIDEGMRPMQAAVMNRKHEVVKVLLAHGADPDIPIDTDQMRSLTRFARDTKDDEMFKLLIGVGGRP